MIFGTSAEETRQQGDQGGADQGNTAAGHQLLDSLALSAGVIITISFQQVHNTPDAETGTDGDYQGLKDSDSRRKESHIKVLIATFSA